jgi:MFS family permease
MLVEIPLLQKGSLYLGHPTYSLTVVLFSMLTFTGLGSYWSGKVNISKLFQALTCFLFFAGLLVGFATVCLEWVVPKTIGFSLSWKIVIMIFFTGIMGFFMGTAFPSGVRLMSQSNASSVPWVWALNGGASVLGSIIAMAIAMSYGYRMTIALGALTYFFTFLIVCYLRYSNKT